MSKNGISPIKAIKNKFKPDIEEDFVKKLHFSIWPGNNFEKFKSYLEQRPNEIHGRYGPKQETLLHRACRYGNMDAFQYLLKNKAVLAARNKVGTTPLQLASQNGRVEMIKAFIAAKVPLDEKDDVGDQAIHYAARAGSIKGIQLLMDQGVYLCTPGYRKNRIIHYAAKGSKYDLIKYLMEMGCDPNMLNDLIETPLHLVAGAFTTDHDYGVDILKLLLKHGADINARTFWGDTPAHYAAYLGTPNALKFLISQGIDVDKDTKGHEHKELFDKFDISEGDREVYKYSLLQKAAKSGCSVKSHVIIERIMSARNKLAENMYYGNRGIEIDQKEMTKQEMSFLYMSQELSPTCDDDTDNAFYMFLKYSPDSLSRLFDLCLVKPCYEQNEIERAVQGHVYFDFFLFNNARNNDLGVSELSVFSILTSSGKERFLIHPLFETFLKLKWYKTWTFYLLYVLVDFIFLGSLFGYTLGHFGQLYEGQYNWNYREWNFWWLFLVTTHSYKTLLVFGSYIEFAKYVKDYLMHNKEMEKKSKATGKIFEVFLSMVPDTATPVLLGLVLYTPLAENVARYLLAFAIILSSYHFMKVISKMPKIGMYVNMLSKVMLTVLNFFASYFWHFVGYAIAFHILLPGQGPFALFTDSFVKVLTMLMGEYDYTINFVNNENSSFIAKIVFVLFVIDMSVVLMNLVLGLAISDIEELQRNSEVRRMVQETCTVAVMENICVKLSKLPFCNSLLSCRILNERTCSFQDVIYLDLVDLDKSPQNLLILEKTFPDSLTTYPCPHYLVTKIAKAGLEELKKRRSTQPEKNKEYLDMIRANQAEIMEKLAELNAKISSGHEEEAKP